MAGYGITVNKADLLEVKRMMSGIKGGYAAVVSGAMNDTLKGMKTDVKAEIRKDSTVKAAAITKSISTVKASKMRISAAFRSKGKFVSLINYSNRSTKKGVSVQVSKKGPRKVWESAFIATMKSGHKGIFSRDKPPYRTKRSNKLPWKRISRESRWGKKIRLQIHELFGPRIPGLLGKDPIMKPVLSKAGERMKKNLDKRLKFEMSKYK